MSLSRFLAALPCLLLFAVPLAAADLARIDRKIAKEPAYTSKPKYCLLVFGPEANTRIWLVQDGATLYVDRDGNGDLTEPGKKVTAEKRDGDDEDTYTFKVGDVHDGTRLHKELTVLVSRIDYRAEQDELVKALLVKNPRARGYLVLAEVEMPGWKGTGLGGRVQQYASYVDVEGVLQFANRPQDAPVVHFGGSWQITLFERQRLMIGRETDLVLGVGTPGLGPGTTAWIDYEGVIPETAYPTLQVSYPPKRPGEPRVRERYQLKRRC